MTTMAWLRKKKKGQQVRVQHVLGDELFDESPPPSNENALDALSSDEAEHLLRLGQPLRQKRIDGDIVIGQEDLKNPFEFDLAGGRKAVLAGLPRPTFRRIPAKYRIEIEGCFITGKVIFAGLWLQDSVSISTTTFQSEVDFHFSQFDQAAVFHRCRFQARAKFADAVFKGRAHFDSTRFDDLTDFYHATFHDGVSFGNAIFQSQSNFSQSTFESHHLLQPCLDFRNCICHEAAFFAGTKCLAIADFSGAQFRRRADFLDTTFRYINLTNTEFQWLDLKWEQIANDKLLFGDVVLEGVDLSQPSIQNREFDELFKRREDAPLNDKHRQYDILKAIFEKQGDPTSADGCFYEWKQVERRKSPLGWNPEDWIVKGFHYLNWLSCGYGVKPIRALLFSLVLIVMFAVAYAAIDTSTGVHWNHAGGVSLLMKNPADLSTALMENLGFSFRSFMNFGPIGDKRAWAVQALSLVESLLGWLTLFLFIITYTRFMLR